MENNNDAENLDCIISKVNIYKLWGRVDRELKLVNDVNFIIGPNGTGKTSIIRLVAGVLRGDYSTIRDIWFSTLVIRLKSTKRTRTILIRVNRESEKEFGIFRRASIEYFEGNLRNKPKFVDEIDAIRLLNSNVHGEYSTANAQMRQALSALCQITWLSLNRVRQSPLHEGRWRSKDNPVDAHIEDLQNRFRAYMNRLKSEIENARKEFDRNVFLSLLKPRGAKSGLMLVRKLSIEKQKSTTNMLFDSLNIHSDNAERSIKDFYDYVSESVDKLKSMDLKTAVKIGADDISKVFALSQLEDITDQWFQHNEKIKSIKSSEALLRDLVKSFLTEKNMFISDSGDIVFYIQNLSFANGIQVINTWELSSGEKQILILLVEALLQQNKTFIYIADEPELSLHVLWQERLVDAIRSLNPNSQILFATHSPDIVSHYHNKIHDFGEKNE